MAASGGTVNIDTIVTQVKRLINAHLKSVCKHAGLPVSGAKAAMQTRIIDHLRHLVAIGDQTGLLSIKGLIQHPPPLNEPRISGLSASHHPLTNHTNSRATYQPPSDPSSNHNGTLSSHLGHGIGARGPHFKESPFFEILEPLTPVIECQAREANRDTVHTSINFQDRIANILNADKTFRVLIFCTSDTSASPFSRVDIAFPHQVEIKVNQDDVKGNLRGLKNKPGTTRPADITDLLRKRPGYNNDIAITYALTKSRHTLVVNLTRQISVDSLVEKLRSGKIITRDRVIREMKSKADDADVIATSTILSLKCPLSTLRLQTPCRSTLCSHNQCFDAASFLQLQEQAPTWTCPICNKIVNFSNLHVDAYVDDILKSSSKSTEQVVIEPTGEWSTKAPSKASRPSRPGDKTRYVPQDDVLDIEVSEEYSPLIKPESTRDPVSFNADTTVSRSSSTPKTSNKNGANKRPVAAVVDLTMSSDEDEPPIPLKKRPNLNGSAAGPDRASIVDGLPLRPTSVLDTTHHPTNVTTPQQSPFLELGNSHS